MKRQTPDYYIQDRQTRAAAGFTLIETIVTIFIIAALLSLVITAAGHARRATEDAVVLSNLKTHASTFHLYTADYNDTWPLLAPIPEDKASGRALSEFMGNATFWQRHLYKDYYGGDRGHDSFILPGMVEWYGRDLDPALSIAYGYSGAFVMRPEFWNLRTRDPTALQYGATKVHEVAFPSHKILHSAWVPQGVLYGKIPDNRPGFYSLADGSAGSAIAGDIRRGVPSEVIFPNMTAGGYSLFFPGQTTENGVRGRDFGGGN